MPKSIPAGGEIVGMQDNLRRDAFLPVPRPHFSPCNIRFRAKQDSPGSRLAGLLQQARFPRLSLFCAQVEWHFRLVATLSPFYSALKLYTGRITSRISAVGPMFSTICSMPL